MPRLLRLSLLLSGLLAATAAASAQEVEVTTVRFQNLRAPNNGNGNWMEADVQLLVRPAPTALRDMVSRVKVSLVIGFELPATSGAERRVEHYRAEAECVALDAGRADVRFYLPPEIVKRDQLHGDPKFWGVEVAVAGKAAIPGRGAYSATLGSAELRKTFQTRASTAAAANDGLLQPQFLTPFMLEYPRMTPTFVRRDAR